MNPFHKALIISASALTLKAGIVKLLNIRARLSSGSFGWPEDASGLSMFAPIFKLLFVCDVKFLNDKDSLNRLLAVDDNNITNEIWFLLSAALFGMIYPDSAEGMINVIYSVVGFRAAHNISFLFKLEPWRTLAYLPGFGVTFYFAGSVLSKVSK